LLLGLFGFGLVAPAITAAEADAKLPACCRRDGRHHCALPSDAAPAVQAICPEYPKPGATPAHSKPAGIRPADVAFAPVVVRPASRLQTETLSHLRIESTLVQRGPPALLS